AAPSRSRTHPPPLARRRALPFTLPGHPFSRSYGVNLPSSLTEDRSSTSGYLPLPTGVGVRYGQHRTPAAAPRVAPGAPGVLRGFSRRPAHAVPSAASSAARDAPWRLAWSATALPKERGRPPQHAAGFAWPPPQRAYLPCPFGRRTVATVSPPRVGVGCWCRTINLLAIAYAGL